MVLETKLGREVKLCLPIVPKSSLPGTIDGEIRHPLVLLFAPLSPSIVPKPRKLPPITNTLRVLVSGVIDPTSDYAPLALLLSTVEQLSLKDALQFPLLKSASVAPQLGVLTSVLTLVCERSDSLPVSTPVIVQRQPPLTQMSFLPTLAKKQPAKSAKKSAVSP